MRRLFIFLIVICSSVFSQNYEIIENKSDLKVLTPSLKSQETAKIKLSNGLIVYIVSDPEIKESAAAMSINAGSWDDPEEYPGMAHFTEHMLFQGTALYPDRNDFFRYISDLGGNFNAYTGLDKTVYIFSVNNEGFLSGLRRFSQFFISPLFDASAIQSELFAVDQEHAKNIENDMRRLSQVWKETSNTDHPHHRFATGNSDTLSKIPRESLLKWHSLHYRANEMRLVVYTSNSLENSIKIVSELFNPIPSSPNKKELNLPQLSSELQKGHIIYIKPIKDIQQMILQWELPKEMVNDETKSAEIIAYAINGSEKSSLLNELKKENLIDKLKASVSKIGNYSAFFEITINLTDEGVINRNKIIQKCFERIQSLKEKSIPSYLYEELNTMAKLNFEYQSRIDSFDFVDTVASSLLEEDISTYPQKTILATNFSLDTTYKLLNSLTMDSCNIFILAPPSKSNVTPNKKEKWLDVEYSIEELPSALLKSQSGLKNNPLYELPPPNPFIPSNLSLISAEEETDFVKIFSNEYGIGYFIPKNFRTPKIDWIFKIKTPALDSSHKSYVLLDLFYKSLHDQMSDLNLQAKLAGIHTDIKIGEDELILEIMGYYEKAPLLLDLTLKKLKSLELSKDKFEIYTKSLQKSYSNSKFNLPVNQASETLSCLLNKNLPSSEEKLKILSSITFEEQKEFQSTLFDKAYIQCIFTGNISIKECEKIWLNIQSLLPLSSYENFEDNNKILSLFEGPYKIAKNTEVMGTGIILAIDENPFSFKRMAAQEVLSKSIKEPFFSEMRSKQKTAYYADSWDVEKYSHLFQIFAVQSGTISSEELLYRFEIFIENYLENIEKNIDRERFYKIKENLMTQALIEPKNLHEMALRYCSLAFTHKDFEFIDKKVKALSDLTYEEFIELSKQFIERKNKKRLAILIEGKLNEKNNIAYKSISSKDIVDSFEYTPAISTEESKQ